MSEIDDYFKVVYDDYGNMYFKKRIYKGKTKDGSIDMVIYDITALWATDPDKKPRGYGILIKTPQGCIYSRGKHLTRRVFVYDFPVKIIEEFLPENSIIEVHDYANKIHQQVLEVQVIKKTTNKLVMMDRIVKRDFKIPIDNSNNETFFSIKVDLYCIQPSEFRILTGQYAL